jgi:hypothetical protein
MEYNQERERGSSHSNLSIISNIGKVHCDAKKKRKKKEL